MAELKDEFGRKAWKDCCGKGCRKCEIAQAYTGAHSRKDGLELFRADREAVLAAGKGGKKKGKKRAGKKGKKG